MKQDGVTAEYREKVEAVLSETYDNACVCDFSAMTTALWAPAIAVETAKAEALRIARDLGQERKKLASLQGERADNAAKREAAQALLPQKNAERQDLEQKHAAALSALQSAQQLVASLTVKDASAKQNVRLAKEKIAAINQREIRIDARLQVLKQASETCPDPEHATEDGNSENQNEKADHQKILDEINQLMDELQTLQAARESAVAERSVREQDLAAVSSELANSQKQEQTASATLGNVAQSLGAVKKRIAELDADIAQRTRHEAGLDAQIKETQELIAVLEQDLAQAKRVADTISDQAFAAYKALLTPYDNWGCPVGMAMVQGTFCMDIYEYPNRKGQTPDVAVSWDTAEQTCLGLGKRLCTDVEWEYTCAGPKCQARSVPEDYSDRTCNLGMGHYGDVSPKPSGWRPDMQDPGAYDDTVNAEPVHAPAVFACDSPYGPADLTGNIWEWIADTHKRPNVHGVRIGGNPSQFEPNCGDASWYDAATTLPHLGFRCCADPQNMRATTACR